MYKDFEQKNRYRQIKITDVAIEKVPEIFLSGFTKEESRYIQEQHKFLLKVAREDNNSGEVGILMDIINWDAWLIMGRANAIETRDNPEAYKVLKGYRKNTLLFMHNHPSTGTFSGEDFKTFCNNESLYMITVVGNDGSVRVLTKERNFDANKALEYYFELAIKKYIKHKNNGELAMRELLKNSRKIGLSYQRGGKSHG